MPAERLRVLFERVEKRAIDFIGYPRLQTQFQLLKHANDLYPSTSSIGSTPARTASLRASDVKDPVVRIMRLSARSILYAGLWRQLSQRANLVRLS